jgi:hypothetical protein
MPVDALLIPDRAGVRMGVLGWLKFIIKIVPSIPLFLASRPAIVDARLSKVPASISVDSELVSLS